MKRSVLPWPSPRLFGAALIVALACGPLLGRGNESGENRTCFILTGLGGVPEYEENFLSWGDSLERLCRDQMGADVRRLDGREARRQEILSGLSGANSADEDVADSEFWLFLIGHGTWDGRQYKFNVRGPDITADDLRKALETIRARRHFLILATGSSGALIDDLRGPNRVIVSATRNERERHPPLFISFFIEGAESAEADANKDRRISLREVFAFSEARVREWYQSRGLLQTEHPVLDDWTEDAGLDLSSFAYLSSPPERAYRTLEARQLQPERIRLEREVEALRLRKPRMSEDEYFGTLERLMVELATVSEKIRELEGGQ
jgi:hypothetical protein